MEIKLNDDILYILNKFALNDFEAFLVGGCVRDSLMGLTPHDYDITTNALPSQVHEIFKDHKIVDTGLKHGTVTLIYNGNSYEITTYRMETTYDDHRHPTSVSFSKTIHDDLIRRDFTINAMAYNPDKGLVDYFNGQKDLKNGIVRCVGDASRRFDEDALRILRALRFASRFHFEIEEKTKEALFENRHLLSYVSVERITAEFNEILCCDNAAEYLDEYRDIFAVVFPELTVMYDYDQCSKYHYLDLWHHTLKVLSGVNKELTVRWAALLHDIGKPESMSEGKDGYHHFINHAVSSVRIAEDMLKRLHFDKKTEKAILDLIANHDYQFNNDVKIKMILSQYDYEYFLKLINLQMADNAASSEEYRKPDSYYQDLLNKGLEYKDNIIRLKDLKVNGNDLLEIGINGPDISYCLSRALKQVLSGTVKNDKDELIKYISQIKTGN